MSDAATAAAMAARMGLRTISSSGKRKDNIRRGDPQAQPARLPRRERRPAPGPGGDLFPGKDVHLPRGEDVAARCRGRPGRAGHQGRRPRRAGDERLARDDHRLPRHHGPWRDRSAVQHAAASRRAGVRVQGQRSEAGRDVAGAPSQRDGRSPGEKHSGRRASARCKAGAHWGNSTARRPAWCSTPRAAPASRRARCTGTATCRGRWRAWRARFTSSSPTTACSRCRACSSPTAWATASPSRSAAAPRPSC